MAEDEEGVAGVVVILVVETLTPADRDSRDLHHLADARLSEEVLHVATLTRMFQVVVAEVETLAVDGPQQGPFRDLLLDHLLHAEHHDAMLPHRDLNQCLTHGAAHCQGAGGRVQGAGAGRTHPQPSRQGGQEGTQGQAVKDAHDPKHVLIYHAHLRLEDAAEVVHSPPSAGARVLAAADTVEIDLIRPHYQDPDQGRQTRDGIMEEMIDVIRDLPLTLLMTEEATSELIFSKVAMHAMTAV